MGIWVPIAAAESPESIAGGGHLMEALNSGNDLKCITCFQLTRCWIYCLEPSTLMSRPSNEFHNETQYYISCQAYGAWCLPSTLHADNQHCIAMADSRKKTHRTEYIALKYHHVIQCVERRIQYSNMKEKLRSWYHYQATTWWSISEA